jgi:acyl-CoA thioesterase I
MGNRIVCIGDSITEGIGDIEGIGWPGRLNKSLAQTYPGQWNIINLGIAGDTSLDVYHRIFSESLYREPSILFVAMGLNDVTQRVWPNATGHKIDMNYAKDVWMKLLNRLKTEKTKVVFVGLTPVNEKKLPLVYMPYDQDDNGHTCVNADVETYNKMIGALTTAQSFCFLDLFDDLLKSDYLDHVVDGLHPDAKGYDLLCNLIWEKSTALGLFQV